MEYKRRKSAQINYNSGIREMTHIVQHVATLKSSIMYIDPLFHCFEAMKSHLMRAVREIINNNQMTEEEKLKDLYINTVLA